MDNVELQRKEDMPPNIDVAAILEKVKAMPRDPNFTSEPVHSISSCYFAIVQLTRIREVRASSPE
jgi:hypothetical protein